MTNRKPTVVLINWVAIAIFVFACSAVSQVPSPPDPCDEERNAPPGSAPLVWANAGLNKEEAQFVVNESLRLVIEGTCPLGDLNFLVDPKRIPVLATEVQSLELEPVGDVVFEPVSATTLAQRAEANGSYVYYFRFYKVARTGSAVVVELINIPQYAANPRTRAFGSGVTIEFSRPNGTWVHTCGQGWIA